MRKLFLSLALLLGLGHAASAEDSITIYTYEGFVSDWGAGPPIAAAFEKQCGCKVNFVGVIDEKEEGYKEWKKQFENKFSVLYDDDLKIIRSYQAMASPWAIVVSPAGDIVRVDQGYSAGSLTELNAAMAKAAGVSPAKLDLTGAPSEMSFG